MPIKVDPAQVKLILVKQREVCTRPYQPGLEAELLTRDQVESLEQKHRNCGPYALSREKPTALRLTPEFERALIPAIETGEYAVLLAFDWGYILKGVVDLIPESSNKLPGRSKPPHCFANGRYWYTHQKAVDFDPGENLRWQVVVNDDLKVPLRFFVLGAA